METEALFEFTCPECERGTVRTTRIHNYKTKIKGYPFTVDEALIGVCDECEAQSFAPEETQRWNALFSHSLQARHAFLTPEEITQLRKALGLSMEDFARLIGSTRQSVSMWEKESRTTPPVRTADLLMKLVRQSLTGEPVDILPFLLDETQKWGVTMELRSWMARLEAVNEKYERLEHFRAAIAPDFWEEVRETIEREVATTQNLKLPVLFFLIDRREIKCLQPLDQFLGCLRKHRNKRARREGDRLVSRLRKRTTDYRSAAGAVFEMEVLSHLLKKNLGDHFDPYPQIPNGRFPDASIRLGQKTVYLEATILSQTEDQERVWNIAYGKMNPSREEMEDLRLHAVHHHPHVSTMTGVGDPYGNALRIAKKIEGKWRQLVDKSPNILCLGLPDIDPNSLSVEWGVKPFFSGDLKPAQSIIRRQKSRLSNDKSLSDIEFQQIKKNIQSLEQWKNKFQAEPRLTGVLVFRWERSDFLPERYFWNPSPHLDSQLSPIEQKTILGWFGFPKENDSMENENLRYSKETE